MGFNINNRDYGIVISGMKGTIFPACAFANSGTPPRVVLLREVRSLQSGESEGASRALSMKYPVETIEQALNPVQSTGKKPPKKKATNQLSKREILEYLHSVVPEGWWRDQVPHIEISSLARRLKGPQVLALYRKAFNDMSEEGLKLVSRNEVSEQQHRSRQLPLLLSSLLTCTVAGPSNPIAIASKTLLRAITDDLIGIPSSLPVVSSPLVLIHQRSDFIDSEENADYKGAIGFSTLYNMNRSETKVNK
ncbi:unnamed protein product, partial [Symbiodinium sp. KB8]